MLSNLIDVQYFMDLIKISTVVHECMCKYLYYSELLKV